MLTVGVDMIEIDRIEGVIARRGQRFLERVYTPGELAYCRGRVPELAARFAAKEAVTKALGTGIRRSARAGARSPGVGHLPHPCARLRRGDGRRTVTRQRPESSFPRTREGGFTFEVQHFLPEDFRGRPVVQTLAGGIIVQLHQLRKPGVRQGRQVGLAGQPAAQASDSIFDPAFLPGRVRVTEEGGLAWRDMEVVPDHRGKPTVALHGRAAARAQALGLLEWVSWASPSPMRAPTPWRWSPRGNTEQRPESSFPRKRKSGLHLKAATMSTDAAPPTGQRLVSVAEMRSLEQAAFARGIAPAALMETAGLGVARVLRRWLGSGPAANTPSGPSSRRTLADETLLFLIGSGNNGGDGLIVARALAPYARATRVYLVRDRGDDPLVAAAQAAGAVVQPATTDAGRNRLTAWLREASVVVDAILGIGAGPPLRGPAQEVLAAVRNTRRGTWPRTIAVDVPSGIDSDSGQADPVAFAADTTISTGPVKVGLHLPPAAGLAGRIQRVELELSAEMLASVPISTVLATAPALAAQLPPRPSSSHKGTFGKALVVGGCVQYTGAPGLAARAAGRVGAGLVSLGLAASIQPIVGAALLDATYWPLPEGAPGSLGPPAAAPLLAAAEGYDAVLIGPGLGRAPGVDEFVATVVRGLAGVREQPQADRCGCRRPQRARRYGYLVRVGARPLRPDAPSRRDGPARGLFGR